MQGKNVFPIFDKVIDRKNKEALLKQHGIVIWMTGLSGSGKTTLAIGLEKHLHDCGFLAYILDGDNVRTGINSDLGFSEKDRKENIRRIAEVSKLFVGSGIITINSFVSPSEESRQMAKKIIGEKDFYQVFINTPLEVCEKRDTKGLYAKARKGEIKDFTGISAPFDQPKSPDLEIFTDKYSYEECLKQLIDFVLPKVKL
ncbi:MAG TPA: adenylyl-sulfate kinase [Bacteroidia bacterium]|jgi:adenylylsulfate kinase|nr:adenylyl-sulfate kinase [Bacteroidia bacterium]